MDFWTFDSPYGLLFLAKTMGKNIGTNISKNLSVEYSQKLLAHVKQSVIAAIKTGSKRAIKKTAEATGNLICNKIADKITKVSKTSQQIKLEAVKNEQDKEKAKERYISLEERQKIIDDLRLI